VVGTRVVSAIGQSAGPRLAKYHAAGNSAAYCRLLGKVLLLVAGLGAALVSLVAMAGGPILELLYDGDYTPYLGLAVYMMVVAAVTYLTVPAGIAVEAMRRFKAHMTIRCISVLVLAALLPRLIQSDALWGAATAMLAASAVSLLGCLAVVLWTVSYNAGKQ